MERSRKEERNGAACAEKYRATTTQWINDERKMEADRARMQRQMQWCAVCVCVVCRGKWRRIVLSHLSATKDGLGQMHSGYCCFGWCLVWMAVEPFNDYYMQRQPHRTYISINSFDWHCCIGNKQFIQNSTFIFIYEFIYYIFRCMDVRFIYDYYCVCSRLVLLCWTCNNELNWALKISFATLWWCWRQSPVTQAAACVCEIEWQPTSMIAFCLLHCSTQWSNGCRRSGRQKSAAGSGPNGCFFVSSNQHNIEKMNTQFVCGGTMGHFWWQPPFWLPNIYNTWWCVTKVLFRLGSLHPYGASLFCFVFFAFFASNDGQWRLWRGIAHQYTLPNVRKMWRSENQMFWHRAMRIATYNESPWEWRIEKERERDRTEQKESVHCVGHEKYQNGQPIHFVCTKQQ